MTKVLAIMAVVVLGAAALVAGGAGTNLAQADTATPTPCPTRGGCVTPTTTATATATPTYTQANCISARGGIAACAIHDLNQDCALTSADVQLIYQYIAGGYGVMIPAGKSADLNGDGAVTSFDATLLQRLLRDYGINGTVIVVC